MKIYHRHWHHSPSGTFFLEALYLTLHLLLASFKEDTLFFIKGVQAGVWGEGG
jgi:hypothetical protein